MMHALLSQTLSQIENKSAQKIGFHKNYRWQIQSTTKATTVMKVLMKRTFNDMYRCLHESSIHSKLGTNFLYISKFVKLPFIH